MEVIIIIIHTVEMGKLRVMEVNWIVMVTQQAFKLRQE